MTYYIVMEYIESPLFSKLLRSYFTDDQYAAFQWELSLHPKAGDLIPRSGGLRKIRWSTKDSGKRSGVRIIYYYKMEEEQIWLLTIYAKNETENISIGILRKIKEELEL
ncbi:MULTISPECIES: transcriptional regulator [unclassified Candidatus Tisiphia]|uniref:transcriptional regulator n=2 Tax=Candidatus Tisiphia TaxID=2996317 RepID=UPI001E6C8908|nr:MAG: transcriptional regulator [Rickettsia endosymbiont of Cimex lectularius]